MFRALAPPEVEVNESGCHGKCGEGPNVHTEPANQEYGGVVKPTTAAAILELDFNTPVPDKLVEAYYGIVEGDKHYRQGDFAQALASYRAGLATGVFQGNIAPHAASKQVA
ncbi:unnamed protein product [Discosporangium mesarthrocarpum]